VSDYTYSEDHQHRYGQNLSFFICSDPKSLSFMVPELYFSVAVREDKLPETDSG